MVDHNREMIVMPSTRVLIVDDDPSMLEDLRLYLQHHGCDVVAVDNATSAMTALHRLAFDIVITDWIMPEISGIELIYQVRKTISPVPVILVITGLNSSFARRHALESGADDFLAKPFEFIELKHRIDILHNRQSQPAPSLTKTITVPPVHDKPPFYCVAIAASTGGPPVLTRLLSSLPMLPDTVLLVVLHSPGWALEDMVQRLNKSVSMPIALGRDGMKLEPGNIYLAPGDRHMLVTGSFRLRLTDDPPENFVRPAADPLFRSVAKAFGKYSVGVILTGMGQDGAQGARHLAAVDAAILVQDPDSAIARSMPETALMVNPKAFRVALENLPARITANVQLLSRK